MSWDAFVNMCLMEKQVSGEKFENCCESAGIISRENGHIYSCTQNFVLDTYQLELEASNASKKYKLIINEGREIINLLKNKGIPGRAGIRLNKEKYEIIGYNKDYESVYLRKRKGGCCIAGTNLCIVIGIYNENLQVIPSNNNPFFQNHGICNERVETLSNFLKTSGY